MAEEQRKEYGNGWMNRAAVPWGQYYKAWTKASKEVKEELKAKDESMLSTLLGTFST